LGSGAMSTLPPIIILSNQRSTRIGPVGRDSKMIDN
jgi:hypothetical protein